MNHGNYEEGKLLSLLRNNSLFTIFSEKLLQIFLENASLVSYKMNSPVVRKGDEVDRIFFIVSGKAGVFDYPETDGLITTLSTGDSIGLSESGFYSEGLRTAHVIALTELDVLELTVDNIEKILGEHPSLYTDNNVFKMNLLKKNSFFSDLPIHKIRELAWRTEQRIIKKETVIFNQGDESDYCYLIKSGEIAIDRENEKGEIQRLGILKPFALFGETALLMSAPRNASALAMKDSRVLAIPKDIFLKTLAENQRISDELNILTLERAQPKRNPRIIESPQKSNENEDILILNNPDNNEYLQLDSLGIGVWNKFNGFYSIREIVFQMIKEFPEFSIEQLKDIILTLTRYGFIIVDGLKLSTTELTRFEKIFDKLQQILDISYTFKRGNAWLSKSFNSWVKFLFTKYAQIFLLSISLIGFVLFLVVAPQALQVMSQQFSWSLIFVSSLVVGIVSVFLHELGHAYTTLYFKRKVNAFGVGWYWITPIAFTDTTDMWLSPARDRFFVDIAGIYVNCIIAGIFSIIAIFLNDPQIITFLWYAALINYMTVIANLDPTLEFDGYYILSDLLDSPTLREDAVKGLHDNFLTVLRKPTEFFEIYKTKEAIYWYTAISTFVLRIALMLIIQKIVFNYNFSNYTTQIWPWILPAIAIVSSFISVWVNTKKYSE